MPSSSALENIVRAVVAERGCDSVLPSCTERTPQPAQRRDFKRAVFGAPQQKSATEEKHDVREPHSQRRRYPALPRQRDSNQRRGIISEDQQDGEHEPGRLAAFLGRQAKWNSDQRQYQARRWQRKAAMELDQAPAGQSLVPGVVGLPPQFPSPQLRNRNEVLLLRTVGLRHGDRDVGLLEGRNLVVVGDFGIDFVRRAIGEVEMQRLRSLADQNT